MGTTYSAQSIQVRGLYLCRTLSSTNAQSDFCSRYEGLREGLFDAMRDLVRLNDESVPMWCRLWPFSYRSEQNRMDVAGDSHHFRYIADDANAEKDRGVLQTARTKRRESRAKSATLQLL
jgi:hypothetical protein